MGGGVVAKSVLESVIVIFQSVTQFKLIYVPLA